MEIKKVGRRTAVRAGSFMLAAFLVVGGLAVQGKAEAAAYRRFLSNSRHHAFAELSANLDELNVDLQKGLYATSPAMLGSLCTQIFGKAMAAQMALGELPYGNIELEQTAAFLAKTGDYAAALSRSAASAGGCTDEQRETLRALAQNAAALSAKVDSVQSDLLAGAATLESVQEAERRLSALTEDGGAETAGSSYQTIESDFPELPALIYDGPFSDHVGGRTAKALDTLPQVTQDEARSAAASALGLKPEIFTLVSAGGGQLPTYSFSAGVDGGEAYVEVTRQGGRVLELFHSRAVGEAALTLEEGVRKAGDFLSAQGYSSMWQSYYINQGNVLTVNYAYRDGGVLCYPDLVKVSVALDNGRIVGFESRGYLMNHVERTLPAPAVSAEPAQAVIAPGLTVLSHQLTLIPTSGEYEVLTHEFKCRTQDNKHVIVYVNAQTGQEEKILILLEDENGTLVI